MGRENADEPGLVPVVELEPASYNPRAVDERRLALIELSLSRLGFVLPIYAEPGGEILSGHQRHLVATRMGASHLPVVRVRPMTIEQRRALNVAFNRGTNDMDRDQSSEELTADLESRRVETMAEELPVRAVDTPDFYPCLSPERVPTADLVEANTGRWLQYARNVAQILVRRGIHMPLVATRDGVVVNGVGRLQMYAEQGREWCPVVYISDAQADFAAAVLNLLTMDFDLKDKYGDVLRYNSFRRSRNTAKSLGVGHLFMLPSKLRAPGSFDMTKDEHRRLWVREHGQTVVDFGGGHLVHTRIMQEAGVDAVPFEPYRLAPGSDRIDPERSRETCRAFLGRVAEGTRFDTVFINSVLNSVPFEEDRRHVVRICHAICSPDTQLYAYVVSDKAGAWTNANGGAMVSRAAALSQAFDAQYEPRTLLNAFAGLPKVQKYHSPEEFHALFAPHFERVDVHIRSGAVGVCCFGPRPVVADDLLAALRFEFDLPYPDGSSMGLVDEAIQAFETRLDLGLTSTPKAG